MRMSPTTHPRGALPQAPTPIPSRTPLRLLAAVAAAAAVALTVLVGPPAQADPAAHYGSAAVTATNAVRRAHHLHELKLDACLERFATRQAERMARQDRMFHQDIGITLQRCGLTAVAENVAYGFANGRSVVRDGWMKSPPHRANILHPSYRLIAVAARKGSDGSWYASQLFGRR
jgi:uncharacterized protein YkwD